MVPYFHHYYLNKSDLNNYCIVLMWWNCATIKRYLWLRGYTCIQLCPRNASIIIWTVQGERVNGSVNVIGSGENRHHNNVIFFLFYSFCMETICCTNDQLKKNDNVSFPSPSHRTAYHALHHHVSKSTNALLSLIENN